MAVVAAMIAATAHATLFDASRVTDLNPGAAGSDPHGFVDAAGKVYFAATDAEHGTELWQLDSVTNATTLLRDIAGGTTSSSPSDLTVLSDNRVLFAADSPTNGGRELYAYDANHFPPVYLFKDLNPNGSSNPHDFVAGPQGRFYFAADTGTPGSPNVELWTTDGTDAGTKVVQDLAGNTDPKDLTVSQGGRVFFSGTFAGAGRELGVTNGTGTTAGLYSDVRSGTESSDPTQLTNVSGALYFNADNGFNGRRLFFTGGDTIATPVANGGANPTAVVATSSTVYYGADDGLYSASGTTATKRSNLAARPLGIANAELYFGTATALYRLAGGTTPTLVATVDQPRDLRSFGAANVLFTAGDATHGRELWRADADGAGVADNVNPCGDDDPTDLFPYAGDVLFAATDGTSGRELYRAVPGTAGSTAADACPTATPSTTPDGTATATPTPGPGGATPTPTPAVSATPSPAPTASPKPRLKLGKVKVGRLRRGKAKVFLRFTASGPAKCRVDKRRARSCRSPLRVKLRRGRHVLRVEVAGLVRTKKVRVRRRT